VNNGARSTTLYNHNNTYTLGYNLVGNPYPSPIDWNAASGWTKTNVNDAVYYFNAGSTNRYLGTYSSYVGSVSSDGVASNIIPAMQGFFVRVSAGSYPVTATLGVTNSVRVNNTASSFHKGTSSSPAPLLRFDAGFTGTQSDPVVVYFDSHATPEFDSKLDASKMMNTDTDVPNLYSMASEAGNKYSIQAIVQPDDSSTAVVPLGLVTEKDGQITFNTRNIDGMPAGLHVYFNDAKTGVVQDLRTEPSYKQFLEKGKYEDRFYLMFTFREKSGIPAFNDELYAYSSGSNLIVYQIYGQGQIVISNMLGQMVLKQEINGNGYHEIPCPFAAGMYVVTLYSGSGKQSKKIVLGGK
jgi:hypothetical protein